MLGDTVLLNEWHVVARTQDVQPGQTVAVRLLDEDIVLWRSASGVHAWQDLCLHRGTKLSLGRIDNERLICPYHGWTYNTEGRCVHIPAHAQQTPSAQAQAKVYQAQEKYGWIWVSPGHPAADVAPF